MFGEHNFKPGIGDVCPRPPPPHHPSSQGGRTTGCVFRHVTLPAPSQDPALGHSRVLGRERRRGSALSELNEAAALLNAMVP